VGRAEEAYPGVRPAADNRAVPSPEAGPGQSLPSEASRAEEPVARPGPDDRSRHDAEWGQPLTEVAAPLVWAASASALIAGWSWARRQLRRHRRLGRIGPKHQPRAGKHHFEEGSR
jgi:hypothetical protein